jgi:hypothetical protein
MVLTVSFVLSPVTGLSCHRHWRNYLRQLDASVGAPGPHDFAVRGWCCSSIALPRPPHPTAHVRDDHETPLERWRDQIALLLFLPSQSSKILKFRNLAHIRFGAHSGLKTDTAALPESAKLGLQRLRGDARLSRAIRLALLPCVTLQTILDRR